MTTSLSCATWRKTSSITETPPPSIDTSHRTTRYARPKQERLQDERRSRPTSPHTWMDSRTSTSRLTSCWRLGTKSLAFSLPPEPTQTTHFLPPPPARTGLGLSLDLTGR